MSYTKTIKKVSQPVQKLLSQASTRIKKISKPSRTQSVQKRSTIGAEVEFFICDKNGRVVNQADQLLDKLKKTNKKLDIVKEVGENMIEVGCYPDLEGINTLQSLLENLETLL